MGVRKDRKKKEALVPRSPRLTKGWRSKRQILNLFTVNNLHYRLSWYNQIIFHCPPPPPLHWRNTAVSLETCLLRSKNASRWHLQKNNRIFVHSACPRFNELSVFYQTKRYTVNRGRFTVLTAASLPFIFCRALFVSSHSTHVTVILCHINSNQVPSHVFNLRFI